VKTISIQNIVVSLSEYTTAGKDAAFPLLVTRAGKIVGILCLTDVFAVVFHAMEECKRIGSWTSRHRFPSRTATDPEPNRPAREETGWREPRPPRGTGFRRGTHPPAHPDRFSISTGSISSAGAKPKTRP
jgi:hypothetical protein